ncbi:hypothetical protein [Alteromonas facilis]|uniref:hypothetical protein n=1 Tax=Alteromonas facilis TaxID=2048004 RepID=UPI000C292560|nr:hypothetical protein [Alteromonas facilis]
MQKLLTEILITGSWVFIGSFLLHYIAFWRGILLPVDSDDMPDNMRERSDPLTKKWLDFGGGYYGIVAFVHLLYIEFNQLREFISDWNGADEILKDASVSKFINLLVQIFVEQFQNFGQAISWPAHYVKNFPISHCAILVVVSYLLYWGARTLALKRYTRH